MPEVDNALGDLSSHGELITYTYKGQKKKMAFKSLINDMRLVVLEGKDALRTAAKRLLYTYTWQEQRKKEKKEPWEIPSVAGAYVGFDPKEHHSFEDVLAVADALMYQKKQQMKKEQNML